MFLHNKLENEIQQLLNKINQLELRIEAHEQEESQFLESLSINLDQITAFVENKDNFTSENWEEIQKQKTDLNEKLKLHLSSIKDPRKTKKEYSSLQGIQRHWLHVR